MKNLKNNNKKLRVSGLIIPYAVLTAVLCVMRFVQSILFIDSATGFYTGGTALTAVLYVLVFAFFVYSAVCSFLSSEAGELKPHLTFSVPLTVVSYLFAALLLVDVFVAIIMSTNLSVMNQTGYGETPNLFAELFKAGAIPLYLRAFFSLLSSVYFFIFARSKRKHSLAVTNFRVLALMPVLRCGSILLFFFTRKISFIRISDLFLEMAMNVFAILFFMAFAQCMSGVYNTGASWRLPGFGFSTGMISGMLMLSRLVLTFVGHGDHLVSGFGFSPADLGCFLFVTVFLISMIKQPDVRLRSGESASVPPEESVIKENPAE